MKKGSWVSEQLVSPGFNLALHVRYAPGLKKSLVYSGTVAWNSLPRNLQNRLKNSQRV